MGLFFKGINANLGLDIGTTCLSWNKDCVNNFAPSLLQPVCGEWTVFSRVPLYTRIHIQCTNKTFALGERRDSDLRRGSDGQDSYRGKPVHLSRVVLPRLRPQSARSRVQVHELVKLQLRLELEKRRRLRIFVHCGSRWKADGATPAANCPKALSISVRSYAQDSGTHSALSLGSTKS